MSEWLLHELRQLPDANWLANRGATRQLPAALEHHESDHRLIQLERFWQERNPADLRAATSQLLMGLATGGGCRIVVTQRGAQDLDYRVGGRLTEQLVATTLPGSIVEPLAAGPMSAWPHRVALSGIPGSFGRSRSSLVDALATGRGLNWRLVVHARSAGELLMDKEFAAASEMASALLTASRSSHVEAARRTREHIDVAVESLGAGIGEFATRIGEMRTRGGLIVIAWLEAPTRDELDAVGALAQASHRTDGLRPLRLFQPGGQHSAATLMTADELAVLVAPPTADQPGLRVIDRVPFDAFVESADSTNSGDRLRIGVNHRGAPLSYPVDLLVTHTQLTGQTGTGKTSLLLHLLDGLPDHVGVLVLESSKQEYTRALADRFEMIPLGSPAVIDSGIVINPFAFPIDKIPVQTHIDQLIALFESAFDLISPLPQLLATAIPSCYQARGWDLGASRNERLDADPQHPCFPTISEVIERATRLVSERGYVGEVRSTVMAALEARLGSLTVGSKGQVFDRDVGAETWDQLFSGRTVVNLDLLGSAREKAFVCGLLLIRLWEERRGEQSSGLRHLLVIEEAHHVLGDHAASDDEGNRSANSLSTRLASEALTEFRAAGQGVVVIDQSPSSLVREVMANTALKIALRSTEGEDKRRLADGLGLDDAQRNALTGLRRFEAIVMWEGMDRPHLVRLDTSPVRRSAPSIPISGRGNTARQLFEQPTIGTVALAAIADRAHSLDALTTQVRLALRRSISDQEIERIVADVLDQAAFEIGRSRHWPAGLRTVAGSGGIDAVRERMIDGSGPTELCDVACPHGGCLAREIVRLGGTRLTAARQRDRLGAGRQIGGRTAEDRTAALIGVDADSTLTSIVGRCVVAHSAGSSPDGRSSAF